MCLNTILHQIADEEEAKHVHKIVQSSCLSLKFIDSKIIQFRVLIWDACMQAVVVL